MHPSPYSMSAYAVIRQGCPIRFQVRGSDELEVTIGGGDQPLMLLFDAESIGAFLERGVPAIQRMEHLHAHEQTESDTEANTKAD